MSHQDYPLFHQPLIIGQFNSLGAAPISDSNVGINHGRAWVDRYNVGMDEKNTLSEKAWFETYLHRELPLSLAMEVSVMEVCETQVQLSAPLAPNRNDKNTGFGGSLASLLFMAGWGWLFNTLRRRGINADVVVMDSTISYKRPTTGILLASCSAPSSEALGGFIKRLEHRGVARIGLTSWIGQRDEPNVMMEGRFVAKMDAEVR